MVFSGQMRLGPLTPGVLQSRYRRLGLLGQTNFRLAFIELAQKKERRGIEPRRLSQGGTQGTLSFNLVTAG